MRDEQESCLSLREHHFNAANKSNHLKFSGWIVSQTYYSQGCVNLERAKINIATPLLAMKLKKKQRFLSGIVQPYNNYFSMNNPIKGNLLKGIGIGVSRSRLSFDSKLLMRNNQSLTYPRLCCLQQGLLLLHNPHTI